MPSPSETKSYADATAAKLRIRRLRDLIQAESNIARDASAAIGQHEAEIAQIEAGLPRSNLTVSAADLGATTSDVVKRAAEATDRFYAALAQKPADGDDDALFGDEPTRSEAIENFTKAYEARAEAKRQFMLGHQAQPVSALDDPFDFLTDDLLRDRVCQAEDILLVLLRDKAASDAAASADRVVARAYDLADALIAQSRGAF